MRKDEEGRERKLCGKRIKGLMEKNVVTQHAKPGHLFESSHQLSALIEWQEKKNGTRCICEEMIHTNKFVITKFIAAPIHCEICSIDTQHSCKRYSIMCYLFKITFVNEFFD